MDNACYRKSTLVTELPAISLKEAAEEAWDVTMMPGQGFPDTLINRLHLFRSRSFGIRVQHILSDKTRIKGFRAVNEAFLPDVLIANNEDWSKEDLDGFHGSARYILVGGVDVELFAHLDRHSDLQSDPFTIGGLAAKRPHPLVHAMRLSGRDTRLHFLGKPSRDLLGACEDLMEAGRVTFAGLLPDGKLCEYYSSLNCVVHTESFAGWANFAAEAMACGIPTICTSHGTQAFAFHNQTALVVRGDDPTEIAGALRRLRYDRALAERISANSRVAIRNFCLEKYADELMQILQAHLRS